MTTWLPLAITGGQMVRQPPVQVWLDAVSPTSSYTVCPDGSTSTVPIEVDMVFRPLADALTVAPPAAGFAEDELLAHPATSATRATAPAAPRPKLRIPKVDICYLTSGRKHPNECRYPSHARDPSAVHSAARSPSNLPVSAEGANRGMRMRPLSRAVALLASLAIRVCDSDLRWARHGWQGDRKSRTHTL